MKTKCQWCQQPINATPEMVAQARAGDVVLLCQECLIHLAQNERDMTEYEREYTERLAQHQVEHQGMVTL